MRASLAVLGVIMGLRWFGYRTFKSVGGISGGTLPLRFLAAGMRLGKIIDLAMEDLTAHLDERMKLIIPGRQSTSVMLEHYWSDGTRYKGEPPQNGKYNMDRLRDWLDSFSDGAWPSEIPFWTMSTDKSGAQYVRTKDGVFKREEGGLFQPVRAVLPTVGQAICYSCTVAGYFDPMDLTMETGETIPQYDGAYSWEAFRPITVVEEQYDAQAGEIIIVDVDTDLDLRARLKSKFWAHFCGGRCVPPKGKKSDNENKVLVISPVVTGVRSFELDAHSDYKWVAIMEGLGALALAFNKAGRLKEEEWLEARDTLTEFAGLRRKALRKGLLRTYTPGELTEKTVALLSKRGVPKD